ncbi:MAG: hypothetical protein U0792_03745 [Gemmataceae bacterium]
MTRPVLLLLVLVPTVALGQGTDSYSSKDGMFTAQFPGKPKENTQKRNTPLGQLQVAATTFAMADGSAFLVSYTDFPPGTVTATTRASLFDGARDALAASKGKVISEKQLEFGPEKLPARELVVQMGDDQAIFRLVLRGDRIYHVAVMGKTAFVSGAKATKFLASFEITK